MHCRWGNRNLRIFKHCIPHIKESAYRLKHFFTCKLSTEVGKKQSLLTEAQNILIVGDIKISHNTKCNILIKLFKVLKGRFTILSLLTWIRKWKVSDDHNRKQFSGYGYKIKLRKKNNMRKMAITKQLLSWLRVIATAVRDRFFTQRHTRLHFCRCLGGTSYSWQFLSSPEAELFQLNVFQ